MPTQLTAVQRAACPKSHRAEDSAGSGGAAAVLSPLALRVRGEYREMPGLRLTVRQAARLFNLSPEVTAAVLHELRCAAILVRSDDGVFGMISENSSGDVAGYGALSDASLDRLVCLQRHWTWADEAMTRFDQEIANGWDYNEDPMSDHPFGAYYHWCALLCGLGEAALERGLLLPAQLEPIRQDIEASLPGLKACRQLLVVIPASLAEQPLVSNLLRDRETLARLRRVHTAFGEALRHEQAVREIDSLDP